MKLLIDLIVPKIVKREYHWAFATSILSQNIQTTEGETPFCTLQTKIGISKQEK